MPLGCLIHARVRHLNDPEVGFNGAVGALISKDI